MQKKTLPEQKIITVSGLYSGIGKTELCRHIISLLPGIAAIKVTINDLATEVLVDRAAILTPGKDTWRMKTGGAAMVVWVRAQEEHLKEALAEALKRTGAYPFVLIEGNSVLGHITPALAFFLCDGRICDDAPLKPSRMLALQKAGIIIHNVRAGSSADAAAVANRVKLINPSAPVHALDVTDKQQAAALLNGLLQARGFLPAG
jgi:Ni2+-binding GTPase involved in maturation of urease and hydrogenase